MEAWESIERKNLINISTTETAQTLCSANNHDGGVDLNGGLTAPPTEGNIWFVGRRIILQMRKGFWGAGETVRRDTAEVQRHSLSWSSDSMGFIR